jgi:hypothetical protein
MGNLGNSPDRQRGGAIGSSATMSVLSSSPFLEQPGDFWNKSDSGNKAGRARGGVAEWRHKVARYGTVGRSSREWRSGEPAALAAG